MKAAVTPARWNAHGNHIVFDVDICKAVAVAVLGPNAKFAVKSFRDEPDALKADFQRPCQGGSQERGYRRAGQTFIEPAIDPVRT